LSIISLAIATSFGSNGSPMMNRALASSPMRRSASHSPWPGTARKTSWLRPPMRMIGLGPSSEKMRANASVPRA
jgi:hypothetical protein